MSDAFNDIDGKALTETQLRITLFSKFQRFVSDPEVRKTRHSSIAEYFIGRWAGQAIPYVGKDGQLLHSKQVGIFFHQLPSCYKLQ